MSYMKETRKLKLNRFIINMYRLFDFSYLATFFFRSENYMYITAFFCNYDLLTTTVVDPARVFSWWKVESSGKGYLTKAYWSFCARHTSFTLHSMTYCKTYIYSNRTISEIFIKCKENICTYRIDIYFVIFLIKLTCNKK